MALAWVVEGLDVAEDGEASLVAARPGAPADQFVLDRGDEAFAGGVVGGVAAVATLSPRQNLSGLALQWVSADRFNPSHAPGPAAMRTLFTDAGFTVDDQHRVRRPLWTQLLSDLITVGSKR